MTNAKQGDTVAIHYTGTLADGTVFDSSQAREPLTFTLGAGQVIPGFEDAVLGMQPGEEKTVTIPADQAYGATRDDLLLEVDRAQMPPEVELAVGQQYQLGQPDGQIIVVTVRELTPDTVVLDANHPLAGEDLTFDLQLVSIE